MKTMGIPGLSHAAFFKKVFGSEARMRDYTFRDDINCVGTDNIYIETHNKYLLPVALLSDKPFFHFARFGEDVRNSDAASWYHAVLVCQFHQDDFEHELNYEIVRNRTGSFGFTIPAHEFRRARRIFIYHYIKNRIVELPSQK